LIFTAKDAEEMIEKEGVHRRPEANVSNFLGVLCGEKKGFVYGHDN
jgi:hypothetical protein